MKPVQRQYKVIGVLGPTKPIWAQNAREAVKIWIDQAYVGTGPDRVIVVVTGEIVPKELWS